MTSMNLPTIDWAAWVASGLIAFVALKMIYETFRSKGCHAALSRLSAGNLLMLGLATSIDALAVDFSIKSA